MINLVIGLSIGFAAAIALAVMWRIVGRLERDAARCENEPYEAAPAAHGHPSAEPPSGAG